MRKIKNEEYDAEYVRRILPNLREDYERIIFTEHFLEKITHRNINHLLITDSLECIRPMRIEKFPDSRKEFELEFPGGLIVIICLFPPRAVILLTSFKKSMRGL